MNAYIVLLLRALKITENKRESHLWNASQNTLQLWGFITSDNQNVDYAVEKHNQRIE